MTSTTDPFDDLAASTDPAMVVVTAVADDERSGCLVGFHAQSSIEPRRYCVWISRANHTYGVAARASALAVHFLTEDDLDLAAHFGTLTGDEVDKFAGLDVTGGIGGVPLVAALPHRLEGRPVEVLDDAGDHVAVTIDVAAASSPGPFAPLRLSAVDHLTPGHPADDA